MFKGYLRKRKQRVRIDDIFSAWNEVNMGVPQGTVLGPLLFVLFINDIFRIKMNGLTLAYADDKALIFKARSWDDLKKLVAQELPKILKWFRRNKLVVNYIKRPTLCLSGVTRIVYRTGKKLQHGLERLGSSSRE